MKKLINILIIFLSLSITTIAQNYDSKWLLASPFDGWFDDQCIQLDFSVNPPIMSFRKTPIYFEDNSITITNDTGEIIFYTNGCDLLNEQNENILNRDSFDLGFPYNYCGDGHPTTQNVIIIPTLNPNIFHYIYKNVLLFNGQLISNKTFVGELEVKDNDIYSKKIKESILIDTLTTGLITATKHNNLYDWWTIYWKVNGNEYKSILTKIDTVIQNEYKIIGDSINPNGDGIGQAVFSPDGSKYAFTNEIQGASIFDFDRTTGELSNYKRYQLPFTPNVRTFGCAFSSNGRFLYVCAKTIIYQIDTWSSNPDDLPEIVGEYNGLVQQCGGLPPTYFKAQLAPDCRIYISATNGVSCLTVIEYPNIKGKACNVINGGLAFPENVYNIQTLPNYPNYRLGTGEVCDSTLLLPVATQEPVIKIVDNRFMVFPNPTTNILNIKAMETQDIPEIICIYNISGVLIKKINVSILKNQKQTQIDLSEFQNGMYLLNWIDTQSGKPYNMKVIKE